MYLHVKVTDCTPTKKEKKKDKEKVLCLNE